jgi:hypothetical protein
MTAQNLRQLLMVVIFGHQLILGQLGPHEQHQGIGSQYVVIRPAQNLPHMIIVLFTHQEILGHLGP